MVEHCRIETGGNDQVLRFIFRSVSITRGCCPTEQAPQQPIEHVHGIVDTGVPVFVLPGSQHELPTHPRRREFSG